MTGSERIEHILVIVGALVPLLSAVASLVNHIVRLKVTAGDKVSPLLSGAGTILNLASVNIDKAIQLARMVHPAPGAPLPVSSTPSAIAAVAAPAPSAPSPAPSAPAADPNATPPLR